ncbi:uncharacterized protein MELLADRAFT_110064 [Melampsora larici-populina 98AG31]|uniref:Uncharacterized protein n=1 Tax=Melampsora larici-populina (strain 98AG31 / pathotype 3-4-7) TaxID=747676 RepID=F4RYJ5_MELLP|nr:uncharacterized protein MELLADRAFT_110064 [Melampsora larici-populina 98AG31]EGG02567.1 hypothetical protein MELLADRAFT_110064 [Melampsora larici-populina 98AG31]
MQAPAQWAEQFWPATELPPVFDMPTNSTPATSQELHPDSIFGRITNDIHRKSNSSSQGTADGLETARLHLRSLSKNGGQVRNSLCPAGSNGIRRPCKARSRGHGIHGGVVNGVFSRQQCIGIAVGLTRSPTPGFFAKFGAQCDATVGKACNFYKKKFNKVALFKSKS